MELPQTKIKLEYPSSQQKEQLTNQEQILKLQQNDILSYKIIKSTQTNPKTRRIQLILKDIFCKHLPKMPCQYVLTMVSDRQHENIIMTYKAQIIGGVCFRVFKWRMIVEIVFFAVKSAYQSKGYGHRLMRILKEQMRKRKMKYLITYADNLAIGFFQKQGFSRQNTLKKERTEGIIKEYVGATRMEYEIIQNLNYLNVRKFQDLNKSYIPKQLKKQCLSRIILSRSIEHYQPAPYNSKTKIRVQTKDDIFYRLPGFKEHGYQLKYYKQDPEAKFDMYMECRDFCLEIMNHQCWKMIKNDAEQQGKYRKEQRIGEVLEILGKKKDFVLERFLEKLEQLLDKIKTKYQKYFHSLKKVFELEKMIRKEIENLNRIKMLIEPKTKTIDSQKESKYISEGTSFTTE